MAHRFDLTLEDLAPRVQSYWDSVDARAAAARDDGEALRFLDGPPNPSGRTHLGTVWNKVLKDVCVRHARMSGFAVTDVPGYDTHLFTTEQSIAAREGVDSLADLERVGIASFEAACEAFEESHLDQMTEDFREFGVWMNWADHYRTDSAAYADSVWWTVSRLRERDAFERRTQVAYWCGDCERARVKRSEVLPEHLSCREADPVELRPVLLTYPLADESASLATRARAPWHVLANQFLAVRPEETYLRVAHPDHGDVYVGADHAADVFPGLDVAAHVEERVQGSHLVGASYERPIVDACAPDAGDSPAVLAWEDGPVDGSATGVVHGVPALSEADRRFALASDVAVRDPLADDCTLSGWTGRLAGRAVGYHAAETDSLVREWLHGQGRVLRRDESQTWPHQCWLCGTPVVPRPSTQWAVALEDRERAIERALDDVEWLPEEVAATMDDPANWHPDWARDPRFAARDRADLDWLVEQEAHWGMPVPVWVAEDDPEDVVVVGSLEELADRADQNLDASELAPRRSVLDDVTITEDGTTYRRTRRVFADRFTAALAAVHVFGPPADPEEPSDWRADLILEARDQPGLWLFMQLAVGVPAFDLVPFRTCYVHGFLTDERGEKMSKSVGNVVTPDEARDRAAVDAVRCFLLSNTEPATDLSLDWDEIESLEATLDRLLEATRTVERLREEAADQRADPATGERALETWVETELETVASDAAAAASLLAFDDASSAVLSGVDHVVSRGLVPLLEEHASRRGALSEAAVATAAEAVRTAARLLAPYAPHVAEVVYQRLDGEAVSVHATDWPFELTPAAAWRPTASRSTPVPGD